MAVLSCASPSDKADVPVARADAPRDADAAPLESRLAPSESDPTPADRSVAPVASDSFAVTCDQGWSAVANPYSAKASSRTWVWMRSTISLATSPRP